LERKVRPPECIVLKEKFLKEVPCKSNCVALNFPSVFLEGQPSGCWIAHTALALAEALRFKCSIEKCFSEKKFLWKDLILAIVLHDVGKLTRKYLEEKYAYHNVLSAAIAFKILQSTQLSSDSLAIAKAIFLHHEYRHWKKVLSSDFFAPSHIGTTFTRESSIYMKPGFEGALLNLQQLLNEILADKSDKETVNKLIENLSRYKEYKISTIEYNRITRSSTNRFRILAYSLALYWFLQLFDNRAASTRESIDNYWFNTLLLLENYSKKPCELSENILKRGWSVSTRIMLSLLPKYIQG